MMMLSNWGIAVAHVATKRAVRLPVFNLGQKINCAYWGAAYRPSSRFDGSLVFVRGCCRDPFETPEVNGLQKVHVAQTLLTGKLDDSIVIGKQKVLRRSIQQTALKNKMI